MAHVFLVFVGLNVVSVCKWFESSSVREREREREWESEWRQSNDTYAGWILVLLWFYFGSKCNKIHKIMLHNRWLLILYLFGVSVFMYVVGWLFKFTAIETHTHTYIYTYIHIQLKCIFNYLYLFIVCICFCDCCWSLSN